MALFLGFVSVAKDLLPYSEGKPGTDTASTSAANTNITARSPVPAPPASNPAGGKTDHNAQLARNRLRRLGFSWSIMSSLLTIIIILHLFRLNRRFQQMLNVYKAVTPLSEIWKKKNPDDERGLLSPEVLKPHWLISYVLVIVGFFAPWAVWCLAFY